MLQVAFYNALENTEGWIPWESLEESSCGIGIVKDLHIKNPCTRQEPSSSWSAQPLAAAGGMGRGAGYQWWGQIPALCPLLGAPCHAEVTCIVPCIYPSRRPDRRHISIARAKTTPDASRLCGIEGCLYGKLQSNWQLTRSSHCSVCPVKLTPCLCDPHLIDWNLGTTYADQQCLLVKSVG